jgi:small subunit ribosomal protein S20
MANHASAKKRTRQDVKRNEHNHYYAKTTRNAIKALRDTTDKKAAEEQLPKVNTMLDKLAKSNVIHKNKASNLKSGLAKHVNDLGKEAPKEAPVKKASAKKAEPKKGEAKKAPAKKVESQKAKEK